MDLATTLRLTLTCTATKTADLSGTPSSTPSLTLSDTLADGTAADQANIVYFDSGTMIADADLSLDLSGTLSDVYGDTITALRVKAIAIKNTSTTASILKVGGGTADAGTNAFASWLHRTGTSAAGSEGVLVRPGGVFLLWAPDATAYAVTAGTGDILMIQEQSTLAAAYEVMIVLATA